MGEIVTLPSSSPLPEALSMGEIEMIRQTLRRYVKAPLSLEDFSATLWWGLRRVRMTLQNCVTTNLRDYWKSYGVEFDVYLVIYDVEGVAPGVYRYDVLDHRLARIRAGDFREYMVKALIGQSPPQTAAFTLLFVADFAQFQWRYRHERALRHLYFDSGRIAHELLLVGITQNLGSFITPATRDEMAIDLLRLDRDRQAPIYTVTMGLDPHRAKEANQ